jgi:hypothetical protein
MWVHRNQIEHEKDIERQHKIVEDNLQIMLETGTQNILALQPWFQENELAKTKNNPSYAKAWMRQVLSVRKREQRREETDGYIQRMRNLMHQFLGIPCQ